MYKKNIWFRGVGKQSRYHIYHKATAWCSWVKMTFVNSEPCMEMSSEKTRDSISSTSTIYELVHLGRSGEKMPAWHFIHQWWKSNWDPAGWFRTGEGFQDKAAIKNEWLFATNTVAPESFMDHVMEKYEGTNDTKAFKQTTNFMQQLDLGDRYNLISASDWKVLTNTIIFTGRMLRT